ncbi:unnamed protein product (macronuclear) [Paramecium tetraurelia]|uniref:Uncharacterized protein n=1 Tax=Paramecium tetraurelia TaxID=5888 RepID=A0DC08_PARTE|nr:uncharacterized protein GSPATT00015452001 [Paramecium tetraurelia]CAK80575.1 unnamed protein product [Paramecium tetraurelia]|eukprot:XP_001447972.1 hypothetical protein (macronuclear) [Paramecium tetraurelia strain d4-2]
MDQEKTKKTQKDYDIEAAEELKQLKLPGDLVGNVAATLLKSVQKVQNEDIKLLALSKFHQTLCKFTVQNVSGELLQKLPNDKLLVFFDYVNYSFECLSKGLKIPETSNSYNATFLLNVYNKLVELRGLPIIIESISQKKTLPTQIITIK